MINYKHLHYFWAVAREGGVARAGERLHLTPQTISGQLTLLEKGLGEPLFHRSGRGLELTDAGRLALSYADEIFSLGAELEEAMRNLPERRTLTFKVGVTDVVPKSLAYRLLAPALSLPEAVRIQCREGDADVLLADLAVHRLDLVISDAPMPPRFSVRGFSHALGDCGVTFFASPALAESLRNGFPHSLQGAPLLLPGPTSAVRGMLLLWLDRMRLQPRILGEFDDSALMKAFGGSGLGVFMVPSPIAGEVAQRYGVEAIGECDQVREGFYAISVERRITHPAVTAITSAARDWLVQTKNPAMDQGNSSPDTTAR